MKCRINEKAQNLSDLGGVIDAVEDFGVQQTKRNSNVSPSEGETVKVETKTLTSKESVKSDEVSSCATSNDIYPLNTSIFLWYCFCPSNPKTLGTLSTFLFLT